MRLFPKVILALLAVVLVAVGVVTFATNWAAAREVQTIMFGEQMTTTAALAQTLAEYYRAHNTWEGVASLLLATEPHDHMMGQRLLLADARGVIVADSVGLWVGRQLAQAELDLGAAVTMDGLRVGTLIARSGGMMGGGPGGLGGPSTEALGRLHRSVWLAALAGALAALVIGGGLAYGLTRPVQALTAATRAIAKGHLAQRVPVTSHDELGELAQAFNAMAADLEKAETQRREMTADIAHELRNPLAVLQSNLEALLDGVVSPTTENLQPLLEQTQLLTRLVDDLRTLALADAGRLSLRRAPTEAATLVANVLAHFAASAEAHAIALVAEIAPELPPSEFDPQRITQVLGNLLSNALRHTPAGGRVVCRVRRAARGLQFAITDTGPGIPPEALPHIFERFYRVDSGRARAEGGTGLGLAIARQLVEAHGGHIWAESAPGQGTTVAFVLPAA
jgi:signal transduction histidine kinase